MKAGLFTVVALAASATAQIHRAHRNLHKKRDVVVDVQYEDVVVYVDEHGNPINTGAPAPAPAKVDNPAPVAPVAPVYVAPAAPAPPKKNAPAAPAYTPAKPSVTPNKPSPPSDNNPLGIVYTPYTDAGGCKSADQVNADFEIIGNWSLIRIYGTDCSQVANLLSVAKAKNAKLMLGVFNLDDVANEINIIIEAAKNDWSYIHTISIGNESVNKGISPQKVIAAIGTARALLAVTEYRGNIVGIDTFVAIIANPSLCNASDYIAANCHAYFDGAHTADQAGQFVLDQYKRLSEACPGKEIFITESGWPHKGNANGVAVPSPENQKVAIASLKAAFSKGLVFFTAFNELWKQDTGDTHGCEKYYGIYGH